MMKMLNQVPFRVSLIPTSAFLVRPLFHPPADGAALVQSLKAIQSLVADGHLNRCSILVMPCPDRKSVV